jgi:hypothetical protein
MIQSCRVRPKLDCLVSSLHERQVVCSIRRFHDFVSSQPSRLLARMRHKNSGGRLYRKKMCQIVNATGRSNLIMEGNLTFRRKLLIREPTKFEYPPCKSKDALQSEAFSQMILYSVLLTLSRYHQHWSRLVCKRPYP